MCRYDPALPDAQLVVAERPGWIEGIIFLGNVEGRLGHWKSAAFHWHVAAPDTTAPQCSAGSRSTSPIAGCPAWSHRSALSHVNVTK